MSDGPPSTADSAQLRLADALRRLTDLVVGRPLADDELSMAATEVTRLADRLEEVAPPGRRSRGVPDHLGRPQDMFPTSPAVGYANPLAPPVRIWAVTGEDGQQELRGAARFGYAYEGPPSCVHGGVIAEVFDDMLGLAGLVTGAGGMTGTLTVRYRRPTPLLVDLEMEARVRSREGRKFSCWGGIFWRGQLTAEAEGVFIAVPPERMLAMVAAHAEEAGPQVVDAEAQEYFDRGGHLLGGVDGPLPR